MKLGKTWKVKVLAGAVLIVFLSLTTSFSVHSKLKADLNNKRSMMANANSYEKFPGERIKLGNSVKHIKGIFGNLTLTEFIIQPTAEFIKEETDVKTLYEMFASGSRWVFREASLRDIKLLFTSAGINTEACSKLMDKTMPFGDGKGYVTTPPGEIVRSFTAETRSKLYPSIGKYLGNSMYSDPISYNSGKPSEWMLNSGLGKELNKKIQSLIYVRKGICYISDIYLLLPLADKEGEGVKLLKTLYRTKSLEVFLEISEGQDIDGISRFWGNLGRTKATRAILGKLSRRRGGGRINLTQLLPDTPRSRLNTYCGIKEYEIDFKDCHWTTINFFNTDIEERYYDLYDLYSFISRISTPEKKNEMQFGDIISIFGDDNELLHSCTYIAGDIVLTKNGGGNLKPFVLSYLKETAALYGQKVIYSSRRIANTLSVNME